MNDFLARVVALREQEQQLGRSLVCSVCALRTLRSWNKTGVCSPCQQGGKARTEKPLPYNLTAEARESNIAKAKAALRARGLGWTLGDAP